MNALQQTALANALAVDGVKLDVGHHEVDFKVLVHVTGSITKLKDTSKTPTVSIPLKATLALALQKAGVQRENITRILTEAMTEALNMGKKGEETIKEQLADVEAAMKRVTAVTSALPKTPVSGKTICDLNCKVEEVETAEAWMM